MKKSLVSLLSIFVLMVCVFASAYAATTYGPTDTVTAATSKKAV